jgi:hypothetical protein
MMTKEPEDNEKPKQKNAVEPNENHETKSSASCGSTKPGEQRNAGEKRKAAAAPKSPKVHHYEAGRTCTEEHQPEPKGRRHGNAGDTTATKPGEHRKA